LSYPFSVMVNLDGERFVDEGEDFNLYTYAKMGREILQQRSATVLQIFDGKTIPLLETRYNTATPVSAGSLGELADRIEERYGSLGFRKANFRKTLETYNAAVQEGVFNPDIHDGKRTVGLRPEKTNSLEAGIVQEWFGRRVRTEVNLFRSSFRDLIAFVGNSWRNIDESWARGIESSVEARPFRNVMIRGEYTRLYTRITKSTSPNDPVTGIGRELIHRARNSGVLSLSLTPRKWSLVAGGRFVGERQDADFNFGVNRNPGYQDVFLSASYQATRHLAPVLRVENLLDARYEEVLGFTALSRSVVGGLRVSW